MPWTASVMTASASCTGRFLASMPMMQTATYSRRQDDDVVYLFPGENALKQVIGPARPAEDET